MPSRQSRVAAAPPRPTTKGRSQEGPSPHLYQGQSQQWLEGVWGLGHSLKSILDHIQIAKSAAHAKKEQ